MHNWYEIAATPGNPARLINLDTVTDIRASIEPGGSYGVTFIGGRELFLAAPQATPMLAILTSPRAQGAGSRR